MTSEDTSTGEINDLGNVCLGGSIDSLTFGVMRYHLVASASEAEESRPSWNSPLTPGRVHVGCM